MIEDIVTEGFAIGSGDPAEPYVGLLRGIHPEEHFEQVKMAESRGFDAGWTAAKAHYASENAQKVRDAVAATELRIHEDYARAASRSHYQDVLLATIALVVVVALLYLSKGN